MSKKLQVLYEEYKKSQGYADGGKVDNDSSTLEQVQANVRNDFNLPSKAPHELSREERNDLIRKQNTSNFSGGTSPVGQHIYNAGDKSDSYSEGGKIPHKKKNLEELKKAFIKFINEEESENYSSGGQVKGYADGTEEPIEPEEQPGLTPEQFQQHLQDLQAQGNTLTGVEGDPQNINAQLPPQKGSPADMQDLEEPQSPNDKKLENDYQNEDFKANEESPDESAYSRLLSSINPNKMPKKDDSDEEPSEEKSDELKLDETKDEDQKPSEDKSDEEPSEESSPEEEKPLTPLQEAQKKRDRNVMIQGILRGTAMIGSGIARTDPSQILKNIGEDDKYVGMPVQSYQEQVQNQQFDPDSKMSATVKAYLKGKGFQVPDGASAADLFKIAPFLKNDQALDTQIKKVLLQQGGANARAGAKIASTEGIQQRKDALYGQRTQAMKQGKEQSLNDKQGKDIDNDFGKLEKRLTAETGSSRSAFGKSANVIRSAEAAQALIDQVPGGNLDNRQIKELARSIDSMLSNGAATMTGSQGLIPSTYSGDAAKIEEYLTNQPKGAGQQAFVQRLNDTLKREKQIAQKQINQTQNKVLSAYSHLKEKAPDRYNDMMKAYGIEPMVPDQPQASSAPPIDADLSKMNPDQLKAYIATHGGK